MKTIDLLAILIWSATALSAAGEGYKGDTCHDPKLTAAQRAGCEIWFYAAAGNGRFHTYVLPQRLPVLLDWYRVLNSKERGDRFRAWGLINDPGCCVPGTPGCARKSLADTYGMDFCEGDDELLKFVGKQGYRDPACNFQDAPRDPNDPHKNERRESACSLEFGTSSGAMGIRKFPNPRFDAAKWSELNKGNETWNGFTALVKPDLFRSKLRDASIEPPFYFGMSCGACHIAFDPVNPPKDPANPKWENIKGAIGNQYTNVTAIMASGEAPNSPLWRIFNFVRAGTVDTSAFPHDFTGNPGTPNALANIGKRPQFPDEDLVKWWRTDRCPTGANDRTCWCDPSSKGKCWERRQKKATDPMDPMSPVMHILKGAEDSIGILEAIQRVYMNIGSCSETCWMNHLPNFFVVDPTRRNFFQTPFDIGQCRRDCPNFRAIEDRLPEIAAFLIAQRPSDLHQARGLKSNQDLAVQLDREFGEGSVKLGQQVFADNCARCHSSQKPDAGGSFKQVDFFKTDANGVREDFLSNDVAQKVSEVGTNRSRALHSNHMTGHVWEEYGSNTLRMRPADPNIPDPSTGGRGYYRSTTLLSIWAHAPFLHNNAVGPEICGKPQNKNNDFYFPDPAGKGYSAYVDANDKPLKNPPPCWAFDPSVEGRFKLYKASMEELLTPPQQRPRKVTLLNEPILVEAGPKIMHPGSRKLLGLRVEIPEGTAQALVGNLLYKELVDDLVLSRTDFNSLKTKLKDEQAANTVRDLLAEFLNKENLGQPMKILDSPKYKPVIMKYYMTSTDFWENSGHPFGTGLTEKEKKALAAFVATL